MKDKSALRKTVPFLLLAVLLTGCQTNTFTHKHFQERVARIHSVGLLPQVHTAMLNTYFGKDPSPEPLPEEQQIRSELVASTIDQLQRHGFAVKEGSFPDSTNQIWNGLMIQQACSTLPSKAARPDTKEIADGMNVNGLIFLNATAYKSTSHRQKVTTAQNIFAVFGDMALLAAAAAGGPVVAGGDMGIAWQDAVLQITLVDGETGDVLWTTADSFDDFEKKKPSIAVEDLFNRYPKQKP
jgi:PBP1b-binding outer membrane lipoprotein LpoB